MEWVDLLISSHKSYEYEAQWHGGGLYGQTDPSPSLLVCSFNIAFLAAILWTLPLKKTDSFIAASVGAFVLLLSLAYCHANIYYFMYLLFLIMSINVIFRDEACNAMFNFFSNSEHKADLYTFISIVIVYLLFLSYFANILASVIVCVSLVANYFIVVYKTSNNFENKVASKKAELETLQERINEIRETKRVLEEDIARLVKSALFKSNNNRTDTNHASMDTEMATTNPLVSLPVEIFSNILEYLGLWDVGRLDTAFLNRDTRDSYLVALQLRKVKVERNWFWERAVNRGILSWLIRRNIQAISWDLQVDNVQLISIANGLPQLQSLNISSSNFGYINITDAGIRALASGLPQLQSLNIGGCRNITDAGVTALARGLPQLQSLDIRNCRNITDEGIRALASGLPQLQSLNIRSCLYITDAGIRALANGLPQLQSLDIGYCRNITDEGIRALAIGCPQLQSLDVAACNNLTSAGREIAKRLNSRR